MTTDALSLLLGTNGHCSSFAQVSSGATTMLQPICSAAHYASFLCKCIVDSAAAVRCRCKQSTECQMYVSNEVSHCKKHATAQTQSAAFCISEVHGFVAALPSGYNEIASCILPKQAPTGPYPVCPNAGHAAKTCTGLRL